MEYFSDKEMGPKPREEENINPVVWGGIVAHIQSLISTGAFGYSYPEVCQEGTVTVGTDVEAFSLALRAELPDIKWPFETTKRIAGGYPQHEEPYAPNTLSILDLIQFCYKAVANPIKGKYHDYHRHYHLSFDEKSGKDFFREKINTVFQRNCIAFVLEQDGSIKRIIPEQFKHFVSTHIRTGDSDLDNMIDDAQKKFLNPDTVIRKEAIERLWDCWERIKTIDIPNNKKESISTLLDKTSSDPDIRAMLEEEAHKLTKIGNTFHIRHSEVTQVVISDNSIIDYLFYRLFAFIQMLLSSI